MDNRSPVQDALAPALWLPHGQAARHLGIADRTIRRRIDAGRYRARRLGREVLVHLPDTEPATADAARQPLPVVAPPGKTDP